MDASASWPVIDADGHVMEPRDLWTQRFPKRLRERAPALVGEGPRVLVDGRDTSPPVTYPTRFKLGDDRFTFAETVGYSSSSQLGAMDVEGIDAAVLFPSRGLLVMGADDETDPVVTTAATTAYNDWIVEFCATDPERLFGVALVDPRDVPGAVREVTRAVDRHGLVGIVVRPNPVLGRPWHHEDYEPLWSAAEALDVAVCFHEGAATSLPQIGPDRFDLHSFWHVCTHPMEAQMAMLSVLLGGIAERHPALRFAFVECGAGWLPYWAWRMDEHVEGEPWDFATLGMLPSEYIERQCFVAIDSDEVPGLYTIEASKHPRVVWGSDYPHRDGKYPNAFKTLASLPGMTEDRLRGVVYEAPVRLFGARVGEGARRASERPRAGYPAEQ